MPMEKEYSMCVYVRIQSIYRYFYVCVKLHDFCEANFRIGR